jgi:hypothetical protein
LNFRRRRRRRRRRRKHTFICASMEDLGLQGADETLEKFLLAAGGSRTMS